MAVIYPGDNGPSTAKIIRDLLILAGPDGQEEVSYGTSPIRIEVPDEIYHLYYRIMDLAREERKTRVEREGDASPGLDTSSGEAKKDVAVSAGTPTGNKPKTASRSTGRPTERRVGR